MKKIELEAPGVSFDHFPTFSCLASASGIITINKKMDSYVKEKLREQNLSSLTDVLEGKCFFTAYKPLFFEKSQTFDCFDITEQRRLGNICNHDFLSFLYREYDRPGGISIIER